MAAYTMQYKTWIKIAYETTRDVKWNLENRISVLERKSGSTPSANKIRIYFYFRFRQRKYKKNYQKSGKINSHICLGLIVYKNFGRQRNHILQTGLEI